MDAGRTADYVVGAAIVAAGLAPLAAVGLGVVPPESLLAGQPLAARLVPVDVRVFVLAASGLVLAAVGVVTMVYGRSGFGGPGLY